MVVLRDVKLQNQGVYSCTSMDFESEGEIRGNTTLEIHCVLRFAETPLRKRLYHRASRLSSSLCPLVLDLHEAVVTPKDSTVVTRTEKLEASCNAASSLATQTVWLKVRSLHTVQLTHF